MKPVYKKTSIVLGVVAIPLALWWISERVGLFQGEGLQPGRPISLRDDKSEENQEEREPKEFELVPIASGLEVPWGAVFTSPERLMVTERPGRVVVVENGNKKTIHTFDDVISTSEEGLMGIALDPKYSENKLIYFAYAYGGSGNQKVRVVRLKDNGDSLADEETIIDIIPAARFHAGCRIAFGPDQKLYITTGDATNRNIAQDLDNLGGKILRLNADGTIPEDNPFEGKPVFSYGHRNPQGIAWDSRTGELYSTEHGPSVNDGPAGGDEVNHIMPGANYGWPLVSHNRKADGTEEPLVVFTPAVAPGGMLFYTGDTLPQFTNTLLFAGLKGEGLYQVIIDEDDPGKVEEYQKIEGINVGRVRDVFQGPEGNIYIMTSNRDGRGKVNQDDDKILKLQPKE